MFDLKLKRMLVILAHPDDESFAVGGTLANKCTVGFKSHYYAQLAGKPEFLG